MTAHADLLLVGGRIRADGGPTDAVAVRDGIVVALGADAHQLRGPRTGVVDLRGGTLLPAFRDGHVHALEGGAESLDCDLVDAADADEVLRRVGAWAATHPDDDWIVGYGYPPECLARGVGRARDLDAVVGDRPVVLWSSDHHMAWVSSAALRLADITSGTPDPPRGMIVRDGEGEPVGTLLEEADRLVARLLPPRDRATEIRGLALGTARLAAAGVAWAQEAATPASRVPAYLQVAEAGDLAVGLDLAFRIQVDGWREQLYDVADARRDVERAGERRARDGVPGRLTATTAKFFVDGVIEGGTGALLEPYCGLPGTSPDPDDHGVLNWTPGELVEAAVAVDAMGLQLHMHAIGDAGVRLALDVAGAVAMRNGPRDRRPVVAHTHLVHPDDLGRFRELGVVANFEPLWAQPNEVMIELTEPRLGPTRSRWQYPIGTLVRSGTHVSFGSDWPVSSHEPLAGIAVAVTRQTVDGDPPGGWLPEQRIDLVEAIAAYTIGTAHQAGDEATAGRIAVGARADLVQLAEDLVATPTRELGDVPVVATWVAGRAVHGDGAG